MNAKITKRESEKRGRDLPVREGATSKAVQVYKLHACKRCFIGDASTRLGKGNGIAFILVDVQRTTTAIESDSGILSIRVLLNVNVSGGRRGREDVLKSVLLKLTRNVVSDFMFILPYKTL